MTVFACVYSKHRDGTFPSTLDVDLARAVSLQGTATIKRYPRFCLAYLEQSAFSEEGIQVDESGLCGAAGELLNLDRCSSRLEQVRALAAELSPTNLVALRNCRGSFAAVLYRESEHELIVAADAMGARPIFVWEDADVLVASTSLAIIECLRYIPKFVSLRGLGEVLCLGFNLSDHTPYRAVSLLRSGECVTAIHGNVQRSFYRAWGEIAVDEIDYPLAVRSVFERFIAAVERRAWRSPESLTLLSGGLDSRIIAGALVLLGKRVTALNFAPRGFRSMDEAFAELLANELGVRLVRIDMPESGWTWGCLAAQALGTLEGTQRVVFSGDGGSVGLGCVYHTDNTTKAGKQHRELDVLNDYLTRCMSLFSEKTTDVKIARAIYASIRESILQELSQPPGGDLARAYHLFLMHNDQRCHLHAFYERIAEHNVEYNLPFFDADFLSLVLSLPLDYLLKHRLYHDLLPLFPKAVSSVPWQTYKGHLPCPLPLPPGIESQFSPRSRAFSLRAGRPYLFASTRLLIGSRFPSQLFKRAAVATGVALQWACIRDVSYVLRNVDAAAHYFATANGCLSEDI